MTTTDLTNTPSVTSADMSQPATAEFFQKHAGIDAATAARLAAEHNEIVRNRGLGLRESAHPAAQDMLRQGASPANKDPFAASDRAGQAELQNHLADLMAPPASPLDYQFPSSLTPETEEAMAGDRELRAALHAEGLPRRVVESIGQELARAVAKRQNETAEQAANRQASVRQTLERWYGGHTDANLRLVDTIFDRLLAKGGATADFVRAAAPHLSALDIDSLVQFAKARAGRR